MDLDVELFAPIKVPSQREHYLFLIKGCPFKILKISSNYMDPITWGYYDLKYFIGKESKFQQFVNH
jgi:hypothetical protein